MMKESPIFTRTYDLLRWLIPVTTKFPREQRFVIASALQQTALGFQERLIEASLGSSPGDALELADIALTKLRFYLRLSRDLGLLNDSKHAHVVPLVDEIGRLLGGWKKAQTRKSGKQPR